MLDALSDFWKPMKKPQQEKLRTELFQIGSAIVFGFVPQASLSGMRLQVSAINTYQFGGEALTSFVLSHERAPGISMIVAESDGEQYLAISRRVSIGERMKMFDAQELENVIEKPSAASLSCKENPEFKGWTVSAYRREIHAMKGVLHTGDFRKASLPTAGGQEFKYTLLASENNEHAVEIEKYPDGRVEIYVTVYRRTSDIGEISHPMRPDLKLASAKPEEKPVVAPAESKPLPSLQASADTPPPVVKPAPIRLQEFSPPPPAEKPEPPAKESAQTPPAAAPVTVQPSLQKEQEKPSMSTAHATLEPSQLSTLAVNGGGAKFPAAADLAKAAPKPSVGMDSEAVECDLKVANKIIDEAIKNEMRLSDVVRRIIELPVAYQEAVQIPVTLSDDDFSLLAIRYGIPASDRNAIKRRIIEDLNSFSGKKAS